MDEYTSKKDLLKWLVERFNTEFSDSDKSGKAHRDEIRAIIEHLGSEEHADVRPVPAGGIGEMSDGYHTFNNLYYQRMVLFAALVKQNKDSAWKSHRHEDGELCFGGGWFIVGIDTPDGSYTYHYEDKDWDLFDCEEMPVGKHWDGHTEDDVTRLLSLPEVRSVKWIPVTERLPENRTFVLACFDDVQVIAFYGNYRWQEAFSNQVFYPTHWMPLPDPPEGGADG